MKNSPGQYQLVWTCAECGLIPDHEISMNEYHTQCGGHCVYTGRHQGTVVFLRNAQTIRSARPQ